MVICIDLRYTVYVQALTDQNYVWILQPTTQIHPLQIILVLGTNATSSICFFKDVALLILTSKAYIDHTSLHLFATMCKCFHKLHHSIKVWEAKLPNSNVDNFHISQKVKTRDLLKSISLSSSCSDENKIYVHSVALC